MRLTKASLLLLTWISVQRVAGQELPTTQPAIGALHDGWEQIDQRFVFLTIELSSTEESIAAINKALVVAGYQQAKFEQRAQNYRQDSDRMDRNGGSPVAWQDFYGKTARAFFFHGTQQPINRPPQMDYIYHANANGQQRAEADAAQLGNRIDQLLNRRRELEAEQSALWCKIAFRALATRELPEQACYRFEMVGKASDQISKEQLAAVAASCKFMRAINALCSQFPSAVDLNQAEAFTALQAGVADAKADLGTALLAQNSLATELEDSGTILGQFKKATHRLLDSSQNLSDSYRLAIDGDRAGDEQRKQNFRAQLQQEAFDFVDTTATADRYLKALAGEWKISPDLTRTIAVTPASAVSTAVPAPTPPPSLVANSVSGDSQPEGKAKIRNGTDLGGRTIDLLQLIDPEKDTVAGNWQLRNGALTSDATDFARIEIPYEPPPEYDFEVIFTRVSGNDGVAQICTASGHSFLWTMGGWGNTVAGFASINGWGVDKNPSRLEFQLQTGKRYTSLLKIRNGSVAAYLDGKLLTQFTTDYQDMSLDKTMRLRRGGILGLAEWKSPAIFYSVKVTEITGRGEKIRPVE